MCGAAGVRAGHRLLEPEVTRHLPLLVMFAICVALMLLAPGTLSMVLCHGLLLPVASSLYGQLFALARLDRSEDDAVRVATPGTVRAAARFITGSLANSATIRVGAKSVP